MKSLKQEKLEYWGNSFPPSASEERIIGILIKHQIPFIREVSFNGFTSPNGGYYRYDFLLTKNLVLIEYDGQEWHKSKEQRKTDRIKNKFCKDNDLTLIRLNKKSWYILESVVLQCNSL